MAVAEDLLGTVREDVDALEGGARSGRGELERRREVGRVRTRPAGDRRRRSAEAQRDRERRRRRRDVAGVIGRARREDVVALREVRRLEAPAALAFVLDHAVAERTAVFEDLDVG